MILLPLRYLLLLFVATLFLKATLPLEPYFSKTKGGYYKEGVDIRIIQDINDAHITIEMAMYFLTNKYITKALIEAHQRGVSVRVVTDDTKQNAKKYQNLTDAGITVVADDNPKALMHDKILIIDREVVWISSGNYTVYAFYRNNDNYLRIEDSAIANYYRSKFIKLYAHDKKVQQPYLSKELEIYFAPDIDIQKRLLARINNAKENISFMVYAFTNRKLADALIAAQKRGVVVRGVLDATQNKYQKYSVYNYLKESGVSVVLDNNRYKMHHKVMIIDQKVVVVGSYNFTKKANSKNAENVMVIKRSDIASRYLQEFEKLYGLGLQYHSY